MTRLGRVGAIATSALAWLSFVGAVVAASPTPTAGTGGDPRSPGQGPGLVGDPAFAILAVVTIGAGAVLATLVYVRMTANREG